MTTYRIYLLGTDGQIALGEWVEAETDTAARTLAEKRCFSARTTVELWRGAERIWRYNGLEIETSVRH